MLIGPFQYAFISGRQLPNSVVMAGEILAAWKVQGTKGFMWKVDFAKANDSLELAIPMGGSTEEGFPGGVDQVDETVCDVPVFFNFGKWAADMMVDSATKRY